jgi:hypothetical protein
MRAVLTYEDKGSKGICGQVIGADGAGEFCIIYTGSEMKIHESSKELLENLDNQGRLGKWFLIYDIDTYSGKTVKDVCV